MALLYVADEETPLSVSDLRERLIISPNLAWRTAEALRAPADGAALVENTPWGDRATGALQLAPAGVRLIAALDSIIARAQPIKEEPAAPLGTTGSGLRSLARA